MEYLLRRPRNISQNTKDHRIGRPEPSKLGASRRCSFEQLEPRQMLAADLFVGPGDPLEQPGVPTGSVSGSVFVTQQNSCESHKNEASLSGVQIQLHDAAGYLVLESTTDEQGGYEFPDLIPGKYSIVQIAPLGFLARQAHVGGGGGISLNSNQVDNVLVHSGRRVTGYDFCDIDLALFHAEREVANLGLSLQSRVIAEKPQLVANSKFEFLNFTTVTKQAPAWVPQPGAFFSSSSQLPNTIPEAIEEWDESPLDDEFHTLNESTPELAANSLEPFDSESQLLNESRDTWFARGFTANSFAGIDEEAFLDMDQLMGEAEIIHLENEPAEVTPAAVAKVASRSETYRTEGAAQTQTR